MNPSLGEFLKQEREKRSITLEQVASATKINIRILQQLEDDQYQDLPAKPFVRGFVTSYARFIGLDPSQVLHDYDRFIEDKSHLRPTKDAGHTGYAFERREESDRSRTLLWVVMGSFLVIAGIVILVLKPSFKHRRVSHKELLKGEASGSPKPGSEEGIANEELPPPGVVLPGSATPVASASPVAASAAGGGASPSSSPAVVATATPKPTPASTPAPTPIPAPTTTPTPATASPSPGASPTPDLMNKGDSLPQAEVKHKIQFKSLADVWIRYQSDDLPVSSFMLKKGKLMVIKAKKRITVRVSNTNSIQYKYRSVEYKTITGGELKVPEGVESSGQFEKSAALPNTPDPTP